MHMASVPQARARGGMAMAEDKRGCVQALASVLNYGKVASQRLMGAVMGDGEGAEDAELGRTGLQCLKAVSDAQSDTSDLARTGACRFFALLLD